MKERIVVVDMYYLAVGFNTIKSNAVNSSV
jgi:hypothetical protein